MRTILSVALVLAAGAAFSSPAVAQYRYVSGYIASITSYGDAIRDLASRTPLDESKICYNAQKMREAATAAINSLTSFGEPLAYAALSPHEQVLKEPRELAKILVAMLGDRELIERCNRMEALMTTAVSNRGTDWPGAVDVCATGLKLLGTNRAREWDELSRKCEQTRRWLSDNAKNAANERDRSMQDCRPFEDAQNAAMARWQAAQRADDKADYDHDRAVERVVATEAKENECFERYRDAVSRGAKSEDASALRLRWAQAANEENDALSVSFGALQTMQSAGEELTRAYNQLANAQRELRQFTMGTNADKIVEQYNNFVRWSELFERDLNR